MEYFALLVTTKSGNGHTVGSPKMYESFLIHTGFRIGFSTIVWSQTSGIENVSKTRINFYFTLHGDFSSRN